MQKVNLRSNERETLQNWRVALLGCERDAAEARIATEDQLLESRR